MKQKPLAQMTPIEMAVLLHELYPDETARFIGYVETATKAVIENPVQIRGGWKPKKMTAAGWVRLATDINEQIKNKRDELIKDSQKFARVLFTGYSSLFLMQCLQDYVNICPDFRFRLTIEAFFEV